MYDIILRNGRIVDGSGLPWFTADVALLGDRIAAIGHFPKAVAPHDLDATGLVVAPGFIDAHVHGDLPLMVDPFHEASVRQGVTTHVVGQDGVAFAPGSDAVQQYMRRYTAGFNGNFPTPGRTWTSVREFLSQYDNRCAINACTLIPNGNVRMEVMGLDPRKPTDDEMARMKAIIRQGMEEGAVGISSGLDYIPSIYADEAELTEICKEIAPYGGVYVTHMRGYNPAKAPAALEEVFAIGRGSGCGVHVSHFNCLADQTIPMLEAARASGVDVTFDLYPYLYGSTTLAMLTLPPEVGEGGIDATIARLKRPEVRKQLEVAFANPRFPIETIRLASLPHPEWKKYEGMLLLKAVALRATGGVPGDAVPRLSDLVHFVCDLLIATDLAAGCVIRHFAERQESDILKLMKHPAMMAGSDGIYVGGFPHPRGTGSFAKYLGDDVRAGVWSIEEAVMKCSRHAARRHGLTDRGLLLPGFAADIAVFDPQTFKTESTFENGRALATGMRHVIVNGTLVLKDGERTGALPGRGLKRGG
jgi:N-acyl-D-amino-acid deacylase